MISECQMIVFDGFKSFPKMKAKFNVMIVNHPMQSCLEVVIFNFQYDQSVQRLYLDSEKLVSKIDVKMFNNTFRIKQQAMLRINQTFDATETMTNIATSMVNSMIISRISMTEGGSSISSCDVFLRPSATSAKRRNWNGKLDFQFEESPLGLIPFEVITRSSSLRTANESNNLQSLKAQWRPRSVADVDTMHSISQISVCSLKVATTSEITESPMDSSDGIISSQLLVIPAPTCSIGASHAKQMQIINSTDENGISKILSLQNNNKSTAQHTSLCKGSHLSRLLILPYEALSGLMRPRGGNNINHNDNKVSPSSVSSSSTSTVTTPSSSPASSP